MPSVDVRTLPEPILIRLHLVSTKMMTDQEAEEATDWRYIALLTESEIRRRGISAEEVHLFRALDAQPQRAIVAAFRRQQQQERRLRRN